MLIASGQGNRNMVSPCDATRFHNGQMFSKCVILSAFQCDHDMVLKLLFPKEGSMS